MGKRRRRPRQRSPSQHPCLPGMEPRPMPIPTRRCCVRTWASRRSFRIATTKDVSIRFQPRTGAGAGRERRAAAICGMADQPGGGRRGQGGGHGLCPTSGLEGNGGSVHIALAMRGAAPQPDEALPELGGQSRAAADHRADAAPVRARAAFDAGDPGDAEIAQGARADARSVSAIRNSISPTGWTRTNTRALGPTA